VFLPDFGSLGYFCDLSLKHISLLKTRHNLITVSTFSGTVLWSSIVISADVLKGLHSQ
jgi:hypothetical protein